MPATALINRVKQSGRKISEADLDTLRRVVHRVGGVQHVGSRFCASFEG